MFERELFRSMTGMSWKILDGDCVTEMSKMEVNSIDAIVTDPPYELGFMGKSWDRTGIAYQVALWVKALNVLKPGGYLIAAGGSRTHHRLACAIEDAGFELRNTVCHVFGSGFPKSLDVSKAIEAEQLEGGSAPWHLADAVDSTGQGIPSSGGLGCGYKNDREDGTRQAVKRHESGGWEPTTEAARRWKGWGTALKPAAEFWTVARKPLRGTVAQNVQKHGTGALNVDGCRVESGTRSQRFPGSEKTGTYEGWGGLGGSRDAGETDQGRWPPNLVLTHSADCDDDCAPSCPVAEMNRQGGDRRSGTRREGARGGMGYDGAEGNGGPAVEGNNGGASRFFPCFRYEAKAGRAERDEGLASLPHRSGGELTGRTDGSAGTRSPRAGSGRQGGGRNTHPTVKPIALMRWLVRLVTPPGGLILDPFAGSGSTGCAAVVEGFRFIGVEKDLESVELARLRVGYWARLGHQMDLFGGEDGNREGVDD